MKISFFRQLQQVSNSYDYKRLSVLLTIKADFEKNQILSPNMLIGLYSVILDFETRILGILFTVRMGLGEKRFLQIGFPT